jgi:vacuolar-type H+-ATPase subunit I/STV1
MSAYASYLDLLRQLTGDLEKLTDLARQKATAVRQDDLNALDQVLKQEQALTLTVRGLEQKLKRTLDELHMTRVPLTSLPEQYPQELQLEARRTVGALREQYQLYRAVSEAARHTLECNLHEIEKALNDWGAPDRTGPGYEKDGVEPPPQMKTDIRV